MWQHEYIKQLSYFHNTQPIGSYQNEVIFGKQMIKDDIPHNFHFTPVYNSGYSLGFFSCGILTFLSQQV